MAVRGCVAYLAGLQAMKAILRFDGGARPTNPGHAGFACALKINGEVAILSRYIGFATNNEAEYLGLVVGLKWALSKGVSEITVFSDSKMVVHHIDGSYRCKQEHLKPYLKEAKELLSRFDRYWVKWQKRDHNKNADNYCTLAINWGRNQNPFVPQSIKLKRPGEVHDPFDQSQHLVLSQYRAAGRVRHMRTSTALSS